MGGDLTGGVTVVHAPEVLGCFFPFRASTGGSGSAAVGSSGFLVGGLGVDFGLGFDLAAFAVVFLAPFEADNSSSVA